MITICAPDPIPHFVYFAYFGPHFLNVLHTYALIADHCLNVLSFLEEGGV